MSNESFKDDVLDAFRLFDTKGKGSLTDEEVKLALSWCGVAVKEWPYRHVYTEQDFLGLAVRNFPDLVKKRSLTLLAAAYRRQYFFRLAESQLSQPIPTWPKHIPASESRNRLLDRGDATLDFLHAESIDTGLICPPRVHKPHWLAFKKWKIFYQTYYQEKRNNRGSMRRIPLDIVPQLNGPENVMPRKIDLARRKWVSNRSMSEARLLTDPSPSLSQLETLQQKQIQRRRERLHRTMQDSKVHDSCDVTILSQLGRRANLMRKPALSSSKQAFLATGLRLPMLHLK